MCARMSDMDVEEQFTRRPTSIIERRFTIDEKSNAWKWKSPIVIPCKKQKQRVTRENLELIKKLVSAKDLSNKKTIPLTLPPPVVAIIKEEVLGPKREVITETADFDESNPDFDNDDDCFIYDENAETIETNVGPPVSKNFSVLNKIIEANRHDDIRDLSIKHKNNDDLRLQQTTPAASSASTPPSTNGGVSDIKHDSGISSCSFWDYPPTPSASHDEITFWKPSKIKCGKMYLVPGKFDHRWVKAELLNIKGPLYSFECRGVRTKFDIVVQNHSIAYPEPPDNPIRLGSRVVALANKPAITGEISKGKRPHRKGIVAEFPEFRNKNRYLIIFEDGCWVHVKPTAVWPLDNQTCKLRAGLPEACQQIVDDYFNGLYSPLTPYKRGDHVKRDSDTEFGVVLNIDSALVIIHFGWNNEIVITHRGNRRFKKIS